MYIYPLVKSIKFAKRNFLIQNYDLICCENQSFWESFPKLYITFNTETYKTCSKLAFIFRNDVNDPVGKYLF